MLCERPSALVLTPDELHEILLSHALAMDDRSADLFRFEVVVITLQQRKQVFSFLLRSEEMLGGPGRARPKSFVRNLCPPLSNYM